MKPTVTKVSSPPLTGLACCSQCYRLISYDPRKLVVYCHACGAAVKRPVPLGMLAE